MVKTCEISAAKRAQIVILGKEGYYTRKIASILKVNQSSVARILKKCREKGSFDNEKRSGRPRSTSKRDDNVILRCSKLNPFASSSDIRSELSQHNVNISSRTIRRRLLTDFGLKCYKPARKPLLSKKNIADRLKFCKKYAKWTTDSWAKVLFSDETTITQYGTYKPIVRCPVGCRNKEKYICPTVKCPPKVMIWGSMSMNGRAAIEFIPQGQTVNAVKYLEILKNKLKIHMALARCNVFQQDGAPCHTARVLKEWFASENIQILDWPGSSPDLNPIENLWMFLKKRVAALRPTSINDLIQKIKMAWVQIPTSYCEKLVLSMPSRIQCVLKNKGLYTKY